MLYKTEQKIPFAKRFFLICYGFLLLTLIQLKILSTYGDISLLNYTDNTATRLFVERITTHFSFALPLIFFLLVETCLHLFFIIYTYIIYALLSQSYKTNFYSYIKKGQNLKIFLNFTLLLLFNYLCLLIINNAHYPNSAFALTNFTQSSYFLSILTSPITYNFAFLWLTATFVIALIYVVKQNIQSHKIFFVLLLGILTSILLLQYNFNGISRFFKHKHNISQPNVVLITIDSLRQDYVSKIAPINNGNYDIPSFFNQAIKFKNAYTPIARSFPALYSILSGNHPTEDNIRFNLVGQQDINFAKLLPSLLQKNGYETLYTTDSNQFHIITKEWGYKHIAAPTTGIYEQIIPNLSDLPISNLILDHGISKYLFPYTYSQSQSRLYNPFVYSKRINYALADINVGKPVFMHFNFEAAHWPYNNRYLNPKLMHQERYLQCLNTANWQINQVFQFLDAKKLLANTIVIMVSDHGEALNITNDKLTNYDNYVGDKDLLHYVNKSPVNYTFEEVKNKNILDIILNINTSGGHGVDVLSSTQYKVAFALQYFKDSKPQYPKKSVVSNVGLQDIYPTVVELLHLNNQTFSNPGSLSLVPLFNNATLSTFDNRNLFLETDLYVPYFDVNEANNKDIFKSIITKWSNFYYINNKNQLELKPESLPALLKTKQYAVLNKQDILAYIPNGVREDWSLIRKNSTQAPTASIANCEIPRPISNSSGVILATLCGHYASFPGYYVYYNGQDNQWTLYKNEKDFGDNQTVLNLYRDLVGYYKAEINTLSRHS